MTRKLSYTQLGIEPLKKRLSDNQVVKDIDVSIRLKVSNLLTLTILSTIFSSKRHLRRTIPQKSLSVDP